MKIKTVLGFVVLLGIVGGAVWGLEAWQKKSLPQPNQAWGSVDVREVSLAFEASGRIRTLLKEEGDRVGKGELLGELDTELLGIQKERAEAELRYLEAQYRLSRDGFRKEDIEKAEANADAALKSLTLARIEEEREKALFASKASSREKLDQAEWTRKSLEAQHASAAAEARRAAAGNRPDEIQAAAAQVDSAKTSVDELLYRIEKASRIVSPVEGIVRSRLAEPGDMTSSSRTVYEISIVSPKWVRVYVTEAQLGMVRPGAKATVITDTMPPMEATVGSVSSQAEFTPKTVQTAELRTALVYEVRLIVKDPENILKLGQPATVEFETERSK